jgi:hypothetical protein
MQGIRGTLHADLRRAHEYASMGRYSMAVGVYRNLIKTLERFRTMNLSKQKVVDECDQNIAKIEQQIAGVEDLRKMLEARPQTAPHRPNRNHDDGPVEPVWSRRPGSSRRKDEPVQPTRPGRQQASPTPRKNWEPKPSPTPSYNPRPSPVQKQVYNPKPSFPTKPQPKSDPPPTADRFKAGKFLEANKKIYHNDQDKEIIAEIERRIVTESLNISFDDIGGLESVKAELDTNIIYPLIAPKIYAGRMKPKTGVLFFGPPGTGKTL